MAPHVREAGVGRTSGNPVLCLHANVSSSAQWRALMDALAPRWSPDLLGSGRSATWPVLTGARLQHELDALAPVLASVGQRFHFVGHSYGAALAAHIALTWPKRVASLVLFKPTLFPLLKQPPPGDPAAVGIAAVAAAAIAEVDRCDLPAAAQGFIDHWMSPGTWAAMPQTRRAPVADAMRPIRQWTDAIFAEPWSLAELARLSMPVLLLGGATSPASARDLLPLLAGALSDATLTVLPGLGHMAPVTPPGVANPLTVDFLHARS